MKIISHNTFSYLPVRKWWMRPFAWLAKCQDKDINAQMEIADGMDIRVRFDKAGIPHFAHGLIEYEGDVYDMLSRVDAHARIYDRYCIARVLLETTPFMSELERINQKEMFDDFCYNIEYGLPRFDFYGGWPRDEWGKKVCDFGTDEPSVTEMHASIAWKHDENALKRFLHPVNVLWLKPWAKRHNREIIENAETEYVMIDFVEHE